MMRSLLRAAAIWLVLNVPAFAAGTLPFAMQQQVDQNGRPIQCLLNIYQTGTTATPQNIFFDFGLTQAAPNPLPCDAVTGRLPMFFLADGTVHARLTDSGGTPIIDIPVLQVLGPSSGGGGGGGGADPSSIASTGDVKWRASNETLTGWVKMNAQTVGSATSGATGRANADTQNLFVYLWNNCTNAHCPVSSGRGASGLADFTANKTIQLPDLRGRGIHGRDQMEATAPAGRLSSSNLLSDGVDTPNGTAGEPNHALIIGELPPHNHAVSDPGHIHGATSTSSSTDSGHVHNVSSQDPGHSHIYSSMNAVGGLNAVGGTNANGLTSTGVSTTGIVNTATGTASISTGTSTTIASNATGITTQNAGGGSAHNIIDPAMLGSFYIKL